MNLLIISNSLWNILNYRNNLIDDLFKQGFNITVIAPKSGQIDNFTDKRFNYININIYQNSLNPFKNFKFIYNLSKILLRNKFDCVLTYTTKINLLTPILFKFFGLNIIINITGLGKLFEKNSFLKFLATILYKINFSISKSIVFQSYSDQNYFCNNKSPINTKKNFIVSGSGVKFKNVQINESKNKFLFVGRLLKKKGIMEFLELSKYIKKKYSKITFTIVGSLENTDDYINEAVLDEFIKKGYVNYLGFINNMEKIFLNHDCVILPSLYYEGIPYSLIQATSYGKIIITYNWRGCSEVVENNRNGYLIENDEDKLINLKKSVIKIIESNDDKIISMKNYSKVLCSNKFDKSLINSKIINSIKE